jgi:hypothetical protein
MRSFGSKLPPRVAGLWVGDGQMHTLAVSQTHELAPAA